MSEGSPPAVDVVGRWRLTTATVPRLLGGGLLVLLGLLSGRPDVAVIGVPLVLAVVVGLVRRPVGSSAAALTAPRYVPSRARIEATLTLDPAPGVITSRLRVRAPGHRTVEALVDARGHRELSLSFATVRTGRQDAFQVDLVERSVQGVLQTDPRTFGPRSLVVLPGTAPLRELPLPHRLQGLTGAHRSVQPGDGGELRDVALFGSGDRLRRIDWKATARRAGSGSGVTQLYVRRTFATSEAHLLLVVDARDVVGPDVATWGLGEVHPDDATSLDIARRAAASIARRSLDQGDRVGLLTLGRHLRPLRPAGGRRQLDQIVHQLARAEPDGAPTARLRTPQIPSGALVLVFSTFLDDEAAELAGTWCRLGHRTLAVDVVPALITDRLPARANTAYRVVRMEREDRLSALAAAGVEVVRWDAGTPNGTPPEVALAALSRTRRAGR